MTIYIFVVSIVTSPFSFQILSILVLFLFFSMSLAKCLSFLFIFSKNHLLVLLIFTVVLSLFHLFLLWFLCFILIYECRFCLFFSLVALGVRLGCLFEIFLVS